ncbi:MAG: histidine kinase [Nocardioidaceae bacterium]
MTTRRQWLLSVAAGAVVLALLIVDFNRSYIEPGGESVYWLFLLLAFVAIATARQVPEVALLAGWAAGLIQVLGGIPISIAELPLVAVLFAAARWGRIATVVLAGFTIPVAPFLVYVSGTVLYNSEVGTSLVLHRSVFWLALLGLAVLGLPWLLGLTLRFVARASRAQEAQHTAEEQAVQAHEIARLREEQNRLARDVHDVVGHSLAVILAQAESAQFLDDADTAKLKLTMENIASSARTSLQDVRQVLAPDPAGRTLMRLDQLLDGVVESSAGKVEVEQVGVARPLPPELEEVAYRVLQEMLTNALKHGDREAPVQVELAWPQEGGLEDSLRIDVRNQVDPVAPLLEGSGQGVEGMRRRLASVRGHLDVRQRESGDGLTFSVTAWLPIRDEGGTP